MIHENLRKLKWYVSARSRLLLNSAMGCQIGVSKRDREEEDAKTLHLLSLPNEVLVKIISFLPETLDRLTLRYVCRKLREVSLTPSLWRVFVWADCSCREEKRLYNVMETCGVHIKRLSFPQQLVIPDALPIINGTTQRLMKISGMVKVLQHCSNLTHLNLPSLDYSNCFDDVDTQLKKTIEEMEHLEVLNIHCATTFRPYLHLKTKLKELTVRTVIHSKKDIEGTQDWATNGFTPPNLNVVVLNGSIFSAMERFKEFLLSAWPKWTSQVPTGHIACLKLYGSYKAPLNLFQNVPMFQLQYGETVALPFVNPNSDEPIFRPGYAVPCAWHVFDTWLLLTDHDDGNKTVHKAKYFSELSHTMYSIIRDHGQDNQLHLDDFVTNLTELDLSRSSYGVMQMVVNCPQLQRLNLKKRSLRLEDLQLVATCCCNLQGLNLLGIRLQDVEAWEILSNMKLIYLSIDISLFGNSLKANIQKLVALFAQCTTLQALELEKEEHGSPKSRNKNIHKLLAHFPSLEYCRISSPNIEQSDLAHDVLTLCKKLKYFYCSCSESVRLSLSSACNNSLQQLCISSKNTDLDDSFMDTVSAHGGLIHVALFVNSLTTNGITTLIRNSPNLLTFGLCEQKQHKESYLESLSTSLCKKFAKRKLFTVGLFGIIQKMEDKHGIFNDEEYIKYDDWLQSTDLVGLWAPEVFFDLEPWYMH